MGGKKKPTISQLVKKEEKQKPQQRQVRKGEEGAKSRIALIDQKVMDDIVREVVNWDLVTPYQVASKYGIKMSAAQKVLRSLHEGGKLVLVARGHREEIYVSRKAYEKFYSG